MYTYFKKIQNMVDSKKWITELRFKEKNKSDKTAYAILKIKAVF